MFQIFLVHPDLHSAITTHVFWEASVTPLASTNSSNLLIHLSHLGATVDLSPCTANGSNPPSPLNATGVIKVQINRLILSRQISRCDGVFRQCTTTYFGFYASKLNHQQHTALPSSLLHQNLNICQETQRNIFKETQPSEHYSDHKSWSQRSGGPPNTGTDTAQ